MSTWTFVGSIKAQVQVSDLAVVSNEFELLLAAAARGSVELVYPLHLFAVVEPLLKEDVSFGVAIMSHWRHIMRCVRELLVRGKMVAVDMRVVALLGEILRLNRRRSEKSVRPFLVFLKKLGAEMSQVVAGQMKGLGVQLYVLADRTVVQSNLEDLSSYRVSLKKFRELAVTYPAVTSLE
jgi:hypothetical protein